MTNSAPQLLASPSRQSPVTPGSLAEEHNFEGASEEQLQDFKERFESYVEQNFGRGTRSQTVTRETYDAHRRVLAEEGDGSRRRNKLIEQGYRLGNSERPQITPAEIEAGVETVLWRYKSEGRGNNYMATETRPRIVAPVEDFYEIISRLHRARPPASGQKRAFKMISERYVGIPREVVIYYMRSCPHCAANSRRRPALLPEPIIKRRRLSEEEDDEEGGSFADSTDRPGEAGELLLPGADRGEDVSASSSSSEASSDCGETDGLSGAARRGFVAFLRLLVIKNLDCGVAMGEQPREKLHAIVEACMRQFPPVSEERVRRRIRIFLKVCRRNARLGKAAPAPAIGGLSSDAAAHLLAACKGERAAIIAAVANSAEAWPIEALTEEEATAATTPTATSGTQPAPAPELGNNGALPSLPNGVADIFSAAIGATLTAGAVPSYQPDLGVFMRTLMTLSAMSVLPIEPAQLANSFRWVGFLLLMVAQAMESGGTPSAPEPSS